MRFTTSGSLIAYSPWNGGPAGLLAVAGAEPPEQPGAPRAQGLSRTQSAIKRLVGAFGDVGTALYAHDTDGSGSLHKAEFVAALERNRVAVDEAEVDELFSKLDVDGNGEIDASEFDAAFYAARLAGGMDVYLPVIPGGGPTRLKKADVSTATSCFPRSVCNLARKSLSKTLVGENSIDCGWQGIVTFCTTSCPSLC